MPSHEKGTLRRDGFLLTDMDVKGNALADKYAKESVGAHRVPHRIRQAIAAP